MRSSFAELWTNMQEATKMQSGKKRKEDNLRQKEFRINSGIIFKYFTFFSNILSSFLFTPFSSLF